MKRVLRQKILLLKVNLYALFKCSSKKKSVAILSSKKWQNKVTDDILLKQELIKNNFNASIVAWDEENEYSKYDLAIIRSIWGYEEDIGMFEKFLDTLTKNNVKILNSVSIMKNNYYKEKQFELLDKYDIPHIKTVFVPENSKDIASLVKENMENEMIIKPSISASGKNTYLLNSTSKRKNTISLGEVNSRFKEINKTTSLMLQPFIKEIDDGEISLIYIDGKFSHAIKRFPSIFNDTKGVSYLADVPKKLLDLGNKVLEIKEYQGALYERIDVVKIKNEYIVMELELVEPDFFIRNIQSKKIRKEILAKFVLGIKEKF